MENRNKALLQDIATYYRGKHEKKTDSYFFDASLYEWLRYHKLHIVYGEYIIDTYDNISDTEKRFFLKQREEIRDYNAKQVSILDEVGRKLSDQNIDYIILKGMGVANSYYHENSHRLFDDIDILINYEDAARITKVLKALGYVQGYYWEGKIRLASRATILHQQLFTHELFNMVKMYGDFESNIDVNHKFGWLGVNGEKYRNIKFKELYSQTDSIMIGNRDYKVFNANMNFIHLCCHYYNSAVYFALDRYYKCDDPNELRLNRLLDIVLLLDKIDLAIVKELAKNLGFEKEIKYVMTIVKFLFDDDYGYEVYSTSDPEMSLYYVRDLHEEHWPINLETRIFDINEKNENISKMRF